MPSNKELQKDIHEVSIKLGITADLSGNNAQLAARLSSLRESLLKANTDDAPPPSGDGANLGVPGADAGQGATGAGGENPFTEPTPPTAPDTTTPPSAVVVTGAEVVPEVAPVLSAVPKAKVMVIAKGKALSTRKGVVGEGTPVTPKMFVSQASWDKWVAAKYIIEQKDDGNGA